MFKISNYICKELEGSKVTIERLELNEKEKILSLVLKKYIDFNKKGIWLWEKFIRYESLNDDMAWNYIKDFVKDKECIIFFNQQEDKEMFLIQSGEDLNYILSETFGFEFYMDCQHFFKQLF